jgi:hypothetical protein
MKPTQQQKRRAKKLRDYKRARDIYLDETFACEVCASVRPDKRARRAIELHHIARGIHRDRTMAMRSTWLAVCQKCHQELDDYSKWPLSKQLSVKLLADAFHFNLEGFNAARDREETAIVLADVVKWLRVRE